MPPEPYLLAGLGAEQRARALAAATVNPGFRIAGSPPLAKSVGLLVDGRFDRVNFMQGFYNTTSVKYTG